MFQLILIPLGTLIVVIALTIFVVSLTKRKQQTPDQRLNKRFDYRKEPYADQLTKHPNKLKDNDVTYG